MNLLRFACAIGFIKKALTSTFSNQADQKKLVTHQLGLVFKNPVGLGAGFDKNAKYLRELDTLGFGFVEVGTVTPKPQAGNDKPRLFRLPADQALINRMGFNNDGVGVIANRLKKWRDKNQSHSPHNNYHSRMIIGGNIGKNKTTSNEDAWKDYETCFLQLHPFVDFFVVNVSSPNTPGLRALQQKEALRQILVNLQQKNKELETSKPILLKISPDLTLGEIDEVIDLATEIRLDGIVATNTTISREQLQTSHAKLQKMGAGGLSGLPLREHATEIVKYIYQKTSGRIPVIASGGISTAESARDKFSAGASLIEVWTGFIYEGPWIVKTICKKFA